MDVPSTATVRGRLVAMHQLLVEEMDRNANDNAIRLLKEIAIESRVCKAVIPEAPSADPRVRLTYWNELYERMLKFGKVGRSIDMISEIRKEAARCN